MKPWIGRSVKTGISSSSGSSREPEENIPEEVKQDYLKKVESKMKNGYLTTGTDHELRTVKADRTRTGMRLFLVKFQALSTFYDQWLPAIAF